MEGIDIEAIVMLPVVCGAMLWITDMLLPEGRIARAAGAAAGVLAVYAVVMPLLQWLGHTGAAGNGQAFINAAQVLTGAG